MDLRHGFLCSPEQKRKDSKVNDSILGTPQLSDSGGSACPFREAGIEAWGINTAPIRNRLT